MDENEEFEFRARAEREAAAAAGPVRPSGGHSFDMVNGQPVPTGSAEAHAAMSPANGGRSLAVGIPGVGQLDTGIKTSQGVDRFLSGAGMGTEEMGRGVKQLADMGLDKIAPRQQDLNGLASGTPVQSRLAQDQQTETDARARDFDLSHTGAGMAGNVSAQLASLAIPGMGAAKAAGALRAGSAAARPVAGLLTKYGVAPAAEFAAEHPWLASIPAGATQGAIAPTAGDGERLQNTLLGAAVAPVGAVAGSGVRALTRSGSAALSEGAQAAHAIGQKYGVDLRLPQLSQSPFLKLLSTTTADLPFSGSAGVKEAQTAGFNNAAAKLAGATPAVDGKLSTLDLDNARDTVGWTIGQLANNNVARPTSKNVTEMMDVLQHAQDHAADDDVPLAISKKIGSLLGHRDPVTGDIPGEAWRQAHSALGRQVKEATGDMKHYLAQLQEPHMDMMEQGTMTGPELAAFREARGQYRNIKTIEPITEKAGSGQLTTGLNPNLLQGANINAKNNRGAMQEMGDLGKKYMTSHVADSKTAQRHLINMAMQGLGAAGLGAAAGHGEGAGPGADLGMALAGIGAGALTHRAINSKWLSTIAASQAPKLIAAPITASVSQLPKAGVSYEMGQHTPAPQLEQAPAALGSFQDLVKRGWQQ